MYLLQLQLRWIIGMIVLLLFGMLTACDPMAPQAVVVVISPTPTQPPPSATPAVIVTRTPFPTSTPDFTPTPTPFPCDDEGSLIELDLTSPSTNESLPYEVYVPPCYAQTVKRFPVVYLLHGLRARQTQWQDLGIVQALNQGIRFGVLPPMLVVMPYYGSIGAQNRFPPDRSYETVVLNELLPRVETDFCTINTRNHRAIGGISRGGFWAYTLAMRFPEIFGIVGGHSAFFPDDPNEVAPAFSPLELARNSTLLPQANLRMYLDNGSRDYTGLGQQTFSNRLTARSIPHTYIINTLGDHNNEYWAAHIGEYLEFYGRDWERNYSALPSCLEPSP